ncbi:MAG: hypothetical protein C4550_06345 [Nitrospiraceae bacterium]|nr:MAG: hypothetical protein C4550_06345 [Nitrospiraceae bacterium]
MALFNYAAKEITLKIVYYGPGLSGKTTNLQQLHSALDSQTTGKLISLATETDRTLFFDFLPVEIGKIKDFSVRFQLYTVPGQIKYNLTRKAVLKGADAVVFVADSQGEMREANMESIANMKENLLSNNINPDSIVLILQYNKRDLPNILPVDELNKILNSSGYIYLEAEAINGKGVKETFQTVTKLLIRDLSVKHQFEIQPPAQPEETFTAVPDEIMGQPPSYERTDAAEENTVSSFPQDVLEVTALKEPLQSSPSQQEVVSVGKNIEEPSLPKKVEAPACSSEQIDKLSENLKENAAMLSGIKSAINELMDELKKSREEQKEILNILREVKINEAIERIKEKQKGWLAK